MITLSAQELKFLAQLLSRAPMNLAEHAWTNALLTRMEGEVEPPQAVTIDPKTTNTTAPIPQVKP